MRLKRETEGNEYFMRLRRLSRRIFLGRYIPQTHAHVLEAHPTNMLVCPLSEMNGTVALISAHPPCCQSTVVTPPLRQSALPRSSSALRKLVTVTIVR